MPLVDDRVRSRLRGVAVDLLMPFSDNLEIQHDELGTNAKSLSGDGVSLLPAAADIDEYHSLSQQERVDMTEAAVDALPDSACVLVGVGGSTKTATDLMGAYDRVGVDAMVVMPSSHTYVHGRRPIRYYEKLDVATNAPFIPYVRGFDPSVSFLRGFSCTKGVVSVKYVIEDPVELGSAAVVVDDDVVQVDDLAGPHVVPFRNEGIEGLSVGANNFRLEIGLALFEAPTEKNWEYAREIRDLTLPFQVLRGETGADNDLPGAINVPIVKKGLELAGLHGREVREPIRPLSADDERRAEELYEELDGGIARVTD